MLSIIGLGLSGVQDLTLRGKEVLQICDNIFLEMYTSVVFNKDGLMIDIVSDLKQLLKNEANYIYADREMVESGIDIVKSVKDGYKTAFLVVGDPLSASTHTDLILRAIESGINYEVIHNTSIMTAVGSCGLQLYNFGETVSIPFWDKYFKPTSYLDKVVNNLALGLNTLCLLDIKVKEQSIENLLRGKLIYEPPRFMTCSTAAAQILQIIDETPNKFVNEETLCVGLARLGSSTQALFAGTLLDVRDKSDEKLGGPLHSLVIVGKCHPLELTFLSHVAHIDSSVLKCIYDNHEKFINSQ